MFFLRCVKKSSFGFAKIIEKYDGAVKKIVVCHDMFFYLLIPFMLVSEW